MNKKTTAPAPAATAPVTWYRPGPAIREEMREGLERAVAGSGAKKLSTLLTVLATEPARAAELLAPLVRDVLAQRESADPKKRRAKQVSEISRLLKEGTLDPEALARAVSEARARSATAA